MSKVYRIYKEGDNKLEGWAKKDTNPYDDNSIKQIEDPNGGDSKKEITSIPSPFARIDLVRTAFAEVNKACGKKKGKTLREELDKQTIYHKMISDALDVGEIFFNLEKFKDKFEILVWSPERLKNLEDGSIGRKCYADALKTYWEADAETYKFGDVKNIYILNYKIGNRLCVVGATSPTTLFFSNANDLSCVKGVQFALDKPFDDEYQPLYKREPEYVKYLLGLKESYKLNSKMKELAEYLDFTSKALEDSWSDFSLPDFSSDDLPEGYQKIVSVGEERNDIEVIGIPLYQKALKMVSDSDFMIKSTKMPECKHFVLPVKSGNIYADWKYTTGKWGKNSEAPAYDEKPLEERSLPYDGSKQPYLTISDFLEDTILCSKNELNKELFSDGNIDKAVVSCLLPVKPLFFEFFSVNELNKYLSIEWTGSDKQSEERIAFRVKLKIPTKRQQSENYIVYERNYYPSKQSDDDGLVVKDLLTNGTVAVMPATPMQEGNKIHYVFSAISPVKTKMNLTFFRDGKLVEMDEPQNRNWNDRDEYNVLDYTLTNFIECFQVKTDHGIGMGVPTFMRMEGTNGYEISYAVDFGTSNTHVEYRILKDGRFSDPKPVEYNATDNMIGLLFKTDFMENESQMINQTLIPQNFYAKELFHFPARTVLSYRVDFPWNKKCGNPFELHNICFSYGKMDRLPINGYVNNIKWNENENQMQAFIADLMFVLRNKTLSLNGDLSKTKLIWFYPNSMSRGQRNKFKKSWEKYFSEYFGCDNVSSLSESYAPVLYYSKKEGADELLSIDIGGGTTDIAFAKGNSIKYTTSFRFAGNVLFEDNIGGSQEANGLVSHFKDVYKDIAKDDSDFGEKLDKMFNDDGAQVATSLFTLKDSDWYKDHGDEYDVEGIDFMSVLARDKYFKMEFIVFFTSILYHAGKIIKTKSDLELPRHISFSGNGSNLVNVLKEDCGIESLQDLAKVVLEVSSGKKYYRKLEILGLGKADTLKSTTCKGGLLSDGMRDDNLREKNVELMFEGCCYSDENNKTYSEAKDDSELVDSVLQETMGYFEALKKIGGRGQFDFKDCFNDIEIDKSWEILDDKLDRADVRSYITKGIERNERNNSEEVISETFFFYPIATVLQKFSKEMYKIIPKNAQE